MENFNPSRPDHIKFRVKLFHIFWFLDPFSQIRKSFQVQLKDFRNSFLREFFRLTEYLKPALVIAPALTGVVDRERDRRIFLQVFAVICVRLCQDVEVEIFIIDVESCGVENLGTLGNRSKRQELVFTADFLDAGSHFIQREISHPPEFS